jgi:hypothetical protein
VKPVWHITGAYSASGGAEWPSTCSTPTLSLMKYVSRAIVEEADLIDDLHRQEAAISIGSMLLLAALHSEALSEGQYCL